MTAPTHTTEIARRWKLDVDTAYPGGGPSWSPLLGIEDFKPPSDVVEPIAETKSDYDSDYEGTRHVKLKISGEVTFFREKTLVGVKDPAAQKLYAARLLLGEDAVVHVRWYDRNDNTGEAYEAYVNVKWESSATGASNLEKIKVTFSDYGGGLGVIAHPLA